MRNRVRQSRTLGSVRGEDGAAMTNLHGHAAGNGGHGHGESTAATGPLLLGARQARRGPHFNREEIRGREDVPMDVQELLPGRPLLSIGGRLDPVLPQDGGDGSTPDVMMEVGERPLDPRVAPGAIFRRHPYDPLTDLRRHAWPSRAAPRVAVVLAGDQRAMPGEQGVWGHDGPDLCEGAPAEFLGLRGQAHALIVCEPHASWTELLPQDAVLLLEIVDHVALLLMDPARYRDEEKPAGDGRAEAWRAG